MKFVNSMGSQNYTDIRYLVKKTQKSNRDKALWKISQRLLAFTVIFVSSFFLLNLYRNQNVLKRYEGKSPQSQRSKVLSASVRVLPVRLIIPQISVNADIEYVGVTPEGVMEAPSNSATVGLFEPGPRPGEKGSAVISGHFNGISGEAAVFTNLHKLKEGDKLYIEDDTGTSIAFVVRESRTYDPGYADEVFSASDSAHLNLVTCDGVWDGDTKSYSKRLVVFADIVD